MTTVTFACALPTCGKVVTKPYRWGSAFKYCSQDCNTKKLSVRTYRMKYE